jgi:hypothetical protein
MDGKQACAVAYFGDGAASEVMLSIISIFRNSHDRMWDFRFIIITFDIVVCLDLNEMALY